MNKEANIDLEIEISRRELRVLLLHQFRLGHKATEVASNICSTMGKDVLSICTAQHWFNRFKNGNFGLDEAHRRRPDINDTLSSRAAWIRSYGSRKTSEWIRQNVEI